MENVITYVGLDVHKKVIVVAMLIPGQAAPIRWEFPNEREKVRRGLRRIQREAVGQVVMCYEAGPCGYALQRQVAEFDGSMKCKVVAPSLIPHKPGERIKTDKRDALKLAEYLRSGLLTEVHPPTPEEEAVRDLCRAREDVSEDLRRCQHRLGKFLLRGNVVFIRGKKAWTRSHRLWLNGLKFEQAEKQAVFDDYLLALEQTEARLLGLQIRLTELSQKEPYAEPVGRLRCFRGINTITAMTIVVELYAFGRFRSARGLMAFLGLVPGEHTSSDKVRRTGITKTGNGHVRRLMIESAWHYRHRAVPGAALKKRRLGQPAQAIAIADKAMLRLNRRYTRMVAKGKSSALAVTAVARELTGFVWAALHVA
jgi:transposase